MQFLVNNLEFIFIQSLRQFRSYKNPFNIEIDLKFLEEKKRFNTVLIIEKNTKNMIGHFVSKFSLSDKPLVASQFYETFSIQKLELNSLEIVDFQLADEIWSRPVLLFSLTKGIISMMRESDSDILLIHQKEVISDLKLFYAKIKEMPFYSDIIFCKSLDKNSELIITNDKIKWNDNLKLHFDVEKSRDVKVIEKGSESPVLSPADEEIDHYLPINFLRLVERGLEIWSEPIVNEETGEVSLLLGYLSNQGISQARPFTILSRQGRESNDASV